MTAFIKASYFAGNVAALDVLGPDRAASARARLAPQIAALQAASRADWLPIAVDDALSDVVCELAGAEGIRAVNKQSFLSSIDGPLIRPVFQGAIKLIGMTPRAGLRFFSRGWDAGMKNAGSFVAEFNGDDSGVLTHSGYTGSRNWHEGMVGIIEGIYAVTNHAGTVDLVVGDDHALYTCRWQAKR